MSAIAEYEVVIVGASLGGVAAALASARGECSTCLLDAGLWVGGQISVQGVCRPDDTAAVNTISGTRSYRDFRNRCRDYYRKNFKLSDLGASAPVFNAGAPYQPDQMNFSVSPKVADTILKQLLADQAMLHLRLGYSVLSVDIRENSIVAVNARAPNGETVTCTGRYFLDATDLGDLLPMALRSDEYVIGAESHSDTKEPLNVGVTEPRPNWIQPITFCIALEHRAHGDYTIAKPAKYDKLASRQQYSLSDSLDGPPLAMFAGDPWQLNMWNYRRYIWARNFDDPAMRDDLSMINTRSNDYQGASLPVSDALDAQTLASAREAALGYLYWLQTACPRDGESGKLGYPELRPDTDAFDTADGIAPMPYIRESRRILAVTRVVAQDLMKDTNTGPRAAAFVDSCGIGWYPYMDVHALLGAQPPMKQSGADIRPFQIPTGCLIPRRVTNLLAASKNVGTTHLTNGAFRLHPIEWNIGEAAGSLAAACIKGNVSPKEVVEQKHLLRAYQRQLAASGVSLYWWSDVTDGQALYEATQMVGATCAMTFDDPSLQFHAAMILSDADRGNIEGRVGCTLPSGSLSRGQAALWLFQAGYV